jgi:hypothetical protein
MVRCIRSRNLNKTDKAHRVSYDDTDTYKLKKDYANKLCLDGTMAWAVDFDDPATSLSALNSAAGSSTLSKFLNLDDDVAINPAFASEKLRAFQSVDAATRTIFWTDCQISPACPIGYSALTTGHGKVKCQSFLKIRIADLYRCSIMTSKQSLPTGVMVGRKVRRGLSASNRTCKPVGVDGLEGLSSAKEPVQVVSTCESYVSSNY